MKIFITGGSGLLGQYLNKTLYKKHNILTQYNEHIGNCAEFNSVKLSITDYNSVEETISKFKPDIVIHTAAISNAEKADKLPQKVVYDINVNATKNIAQICEKYKSKLIYTSTDLVYAGYRGSFLNENSKLIPISFYAETKLMGEVKIQETFDNYVILRMALLIGFGLNHSRNFFHQMYENLKMGKPVKLFTDQYRSPLELNDAARMINELIEKEIKGEIINFGGNERLSRYDLGEILCEEADLDKSLLIKTTMDEENYTYKVSDVSMNIDKLKSFGISPMNIRDSIRNLFKMNGKIK